MFIRLKMGPNVIWRLKLKSARGIVAPISFMHPDKRDSEYCNQSHFAWSPNMSHAIDAWEPKFGLGSGTSLASQAVRKNRFLSGSLRWPRPAPASGQKAQLSNCPCTYKDLGRTLNGNRACILGSTGARITACTGRVLELRLRGSHGGVLAITSKG